MSPRAPQFDFQRAAREAMLREGFKPDYPPQVLSEVKSFAAAATTNASSRDLRGLLWSSIDNTESRDLDQVEFAERLPGDRIRVLVGIADVDSVVKTGCATDLHARDNATSVYTGGPVFAMLPERLSTDLTSLGQDADRAAIVIEFITSSNGDVCCGDIHTAALRNRARLNYDQVGQWLTGKSAAPCDGTPPDGLCDQLRLQEEASRRLKKFRSENGALTFDNAESAPVVDGNQVRGFNFLEANPARDIIESFMVAANEAMARLLRDRNSLCLRRVVRTPKHWDRIQEIASGLNFKLPPNPDSRSLGEFLETRHAADPVRFPELSLAVLKCLGPGEYIVEHPGTEHEGHFGLAVEDYTHSTAPNRRYADLIMQRLLKSAVTGGAPAFTETDLTTLAAHCTDREAAARHVERFMKKVAAASLLGPQIGRQFDTIITGVSPKGTFARLLTVPAEGLVIRGGRGLRVGDRVRLRLAGVDVERGFIDLERAA